MGSGIAKVNSRSAPEKLPCLEDGLILCGHVMAKGESRKIPLFPLLAGALAVAVCLNFPVGADARKPSLKAAFTLSGRTVTVKGTVAKGGPAKPARRQWRASLEEKSGKKWFSRKTGRLGKRGSGSTFKLRWKAPASRKSVTIRVRILAKKRTVALGKSKLLNLNRSQTPVVPEPELPRLKFDFSGARGLAIVEKAVPRTSQLRATSETGSSNLAVVEGDGGTRDAVTSGNVDVGKTLVAPDGTVYLIDSVLITDLEGRDQFSPEYEPCSLLAVNPDTGEPTCIDPSGVYWNPFTASRFLPPIGFDASGGVYYQGFGTNSGEFGIKYFKDGVLSDLYVSCLNQVDQFLVTPDGHVFISSTNGYTECDEPYEGEFFRRINPDGSIDEIDNQSKDFMDIFPDGKVYVGDSSNGVESLGVSSDSYDHPTWIGPSGSEPADGQFNVDALCGAEDSPAYVDNYAFCSTNGGNVGRSFHIGGKTYMVSGTLPSMCPSCENGFGSLVQYYPEVKFRDTDVRKTWAAAKAGSEILLAGKNSTGEFIMTRFDPETEAEAVLIGPEAEVETYHLGYSASNNEAIFDGRRLSDDSYVTGRVDLTNNQVVINDQVTVRWEDFVAFD